MSKTRIWFFPTSPRSPSKIKDELELLSRFDGVNWWEQDTHGQLRHQLKYAQLLAESEFYQGETSESYTDFSARDRLRAPQMLGFAYIDWQHILHITPAGWQLINGQRIEILFLKQLLKLQFPSWQHGGNPRTRHRYVVSDMNVFPFVESLAVLEAVDGVTKKEMAMFILPALSHEEAMQAIDKIHQFRRELKRQTPGRERSEYTEHIHKQIFYEVYREEIEAGDIDTRETPTLSIDKFVKKKMANALDYADAAFRYFQYTGVFTRTYNGIKIVSARREQIHRILNEMTFELIPYTKVDDFYGHFGNPNIPYLPWENEPDLTRDAAELQEQVREIIEQLETKAPSVTLPQPPLEPTPSLEALMQYSYELRILLKTTRAQLLSVQLHEPEGVRQIIQTYQQILRREIADRPLFLEWNTWRAFLALDDFCELKPNCGLDEELMPISIASGRQPDIEINYCGEYVVAVEVTLQSGERQFDKEAEPVTRHVANIQIRELAYKGRKVYCLFIAPQINANTIRQFHLYLTHEIIRGAGRLTIIPLSLMDFMDLFEFCLANNAFSMQSFRDLLDRIEAEGFALPNIEAEEWQVKIQKSISQWKHSCLQSTNA